MQLQLMIRGQFLCTIRSGEHNDKVCDCLEMLSSGVGRNQQSRRKILVVTNKFVALKFMNLLSERDLHSGAKKRRCNVDDVLFADGDKNHNGLVENLITDNWISVSSV